MSGQDRATAPGEPRIDASVAHPARRYNYWLGGKDHFVADRESGDAIAAAFPSVRIAAVENRRFLRRAVSYLAAEAGIRQFLDVGTGLPTANNTHEVAQAIAPQSRIVYVDNDPLVLVHARALLRSTTEGANAYIEADLREPAGILTDPDLKRTLDLSRPVGLMLVAILHFIRDDENPYAAVAELIDALPSGSYLAITHFASDLLSAETVAALRQATTRLPAVQSGQFRSRPQFAKFLDGLELVEPGIVPVAEWRAKEEPEPRPSAEDAPLYAAVARIP